MPKKTAKHYEVLGIDAINGITLPPQEWLVPGAVGHPSLGMLISRRGIGKTWFSLHLGLSVASGGVWSSFFPACKRRGVLYVDGEMAMPDIVGRIQAMRGSGDFYLLNGERLALNRDAINLAETSDRERLMYTMTDIERRTGTAVDLLILDNWSSLVYGLDENDNSELDEIRKWMIEMRHLEVSVVLVHHVGTTPGRQRGASAREDQLNYTINLGQIADHDSFETTLHAEWDKCRGPRPVPDQFYFNVKSKDGWITISDQKAMALE